MLTRTEFSQYFNSIRCGFGDRDSPLWEAEHFDFGKSVKCEFFVCVCPIFDSCKSKKEYWNWCKLHCNGTVVCFSSSDTEEWWGFTDQQDIFLWTLRWA